jgi:hypothetical protein
MIEEIAEKVGAKINLVSSKDGIWVEKTKMLSKSDDLVSEVRKLNTWEDIVLVRWAWWGWSGAWEAIRWKWLYLTDNIDVANHYWKNIERITIKNSDILDWNTTFKNSKQVISKLPKEMQRFLDDDFEYSYNSLLRTIEWNTWLEAEKIADALNWILSNKYKWVRFNIWLVNDTLDEMWLWDKNAFIFFQQSKPKLLKKSN